MTYQKHLPRFPLNNYIESIIFIQGNNKGTGLPKTAMSLVFNLEDSFKLFNDKEFSTSIDFKKYWIAGLQTKPTHVESYGLSKMFVVQFNTLGASFFLREPLHYFTNQYVPLDHVFYKDAEETWEKLQEAESLKEKFLIIEHFLLQKFVNHKSPNEKLIASLQLLFQHAANPSIKQLCEKMSISRKHLNHSFNQFAGVSPKTLSSLKRIQSTLTILSACKPEKLTAVAYQSDYFDQAHFIHDFKRFTQLKPSEYVKLVSAKSSMRVIPHFIPVD